MFEQPEVKKADRDFTLYLLKIKICISQNPQKIKYREHHFQRKEVQAISFWLPELGSN